MFHRVRRPHIPTSRPALSMLALQVDLADLDPSNAELVMQWKIVQGEDINEHGLDVRSATTAS